MTESSTGSPTEAVQLQELTTGALQTDLAAVTTTGALQTDRAAVTTSVLPAVITEEVTEAQDPNLALEELAKVRNKRNVINCLPDLATINVCQTIVTGKISTQGFNYSCASFILSC